MAYTKLFGETMKTTKKPKPELPVEVRKAIDAIVPPEKRAAIQVLKNHYESLKKNAVDIFDQLEKTKRERFDILRKQAESEAPGKIPKGFCRDEGNALWIERENGTATIRGKQYYPMPKKVQPMITAYYEASDSKSLTRKELRKMSDEIDATLRKSLKRHKPCPNREIFWTRDKVYQVMDIKWEIDLTEAKRLDEEIKTLKKSFDDAEWVKWLLSGPVGFHLREVFPGHSVFR